MKRLMVWILLLALLYAYPASAQQADDPAYKDILTREAWTSAYDTGNTIQLNPDGTASFQINGVKMDGTWSTSGTYMYEAATVVVAYSQYGEQTLTLQARVEGDAGLKLQAKSLGETFYQKSTVAAMKENAEAKKQAIKTKKTFALGLMTASLNSVKVYRAREEALKDAWFSNARTFTVHEGSVWLLAEGTVTHAKEDSVSLNRISAYVILNGNTVYPAEVMTSVQEGSDTYRSAHYTSSVPAGGEQPLYVYAQLPQAKLKKAESAEIRLCLYSQWEDYYTPSPEFFFEGDVIYGLSLSKKQIADAMKEKAGKVSYFKENKKLPLPGSYADLTQASRSEQKETLNLTINYRQEAVITGTRYEFRQKYSDQSIEKLVNTYIKALKKAGFEVTRLKYDRETNIYYSVRQNKKQVAVIGYYPAYTYLNMYVVK